MGRIEGRFSSLRSRTNSDERETDTPDGASSTSAADETANVPESQPNSLDDELVRAVADRVYQCLMEDLRIGRERQRWTGKVGFFHKGGR